MWAAVQLSARVICIVLAFGPTVVAEGGDGARCGDYEALYQEVVHGLGACRYSGSCPVECKDKHEALRDNPCFGEYLNLHGHFCSEMAKIGQFCDVDLTSQCTTAVDIGSLQEDSHDSEPRYTSALLIAAAKNVQLVAQLGISDGIPTHAYEESECLLGNGNLRIYGGSQAYAGTMKHEGQTDNQGILLLESEGNEGTILHIITETDHDEHKVPNTFSLIQVDAMDSTKVYGVVSGSCLGSVHAAVRDPVVASLCSYSTETGVIKTLRSWRDQTEVDFATAAFDPCQKIYFVGVYDGRDGVEYIEAFHVHNASLVRVPLGAGAVLESLYFDAKKSCLSSDRKLYSSMILNETCVLSVVDTTNLQIMEVARYNLESDQHFSMLTAFEGTNDDFSARFLSLLYEASWDRHEIVQTDTTNNSWQFMLFADVVGPTPTSLMLMDVQTPLHHRRKRCHGKHCVYDSGNAQTESTNAPAINFIGDYEKLTYVNESISVEIHISDLDTPVVQLLLHVEVSNAHLVRESDIVVDGDTEVRFLTIFPIPSAAGFCRVTVFVEDEKGEEFSKSSFLLYVGYRGCLPGDLNRGCEYANRELEPTKYSEINDEESRISTAGEVLDYRIQSKNQFEIDLQRAPNFLAADCALPWYRVTECSTIFHVDCIAAPGHGQDDIARGSQNLTSDVSYIDDGIYEILTEPLRRSGTYTVYTLTFRGEQVRGSPFTVLVIPATMHPPSCDYFGKSRDSAYEGVPGEAYEGGQVPRNQLYIRARDRFYNERRASTDHFGLQLMPTLDQHVQNSSIQTFTANVQPASGFEQEIPNQYTMTTGAVYAVDFWFQGPIYEQLIAVCNRNGSHASGDGSCADCSVAREHWSECIQTTALNENSTAQLDIYVVPRIFYMENGVDQFEADTSFVFIDAICPNGTEYGEGGRDDSAHIYDSGRGENTPESEREVWTGLVEGGFNQTCKPVGAGVNYTFYIQSVDEFGNYLLTEDTYATRTVEANAIAEDNTKIEGWTQYVGLGVFSVAIQFQLAGWQPVILTSLGSRIPNTPFQVRVIPGALSAEGSTVDGVGTVMATEGVPARLPEGNMIYVRAKDLYGNQRDSTEDMFAIDPLENEKFFQATTVYEGGGNTRVTFWWDAAFVQNYHVCIRFDPLDPTGGYGACSWLRSHGHGNPNHQFDVHEEVTCLDDSTLGELNSGGDTQACSLQCLEHDRCKAFKFIVSGSGAGRCTFSANCGVALEFLDTGVGEAAMVASANQAVYMKDVRDAKARRTDKEVGSVFVFMRINQGSKYTDPVFSKPICLNNIFDDNACSIFSGVAGVTSSFTIESRNELEFPNYRGGDEYDVSILGGAPDPTMVGPVDVQWLRIQYYLVEYSPTIAGEYIVEIKLNSEQHGQGRDVGNSPFRAVVRPDIPSPTESYSAFPSNFEVGQTNAIDLFIRDRFNNTCEPDEDHQLQVTAVAIVTSASHEFSTFSLNETTGGAYRAQVELVVAGFYDIEVKIMTKRTVYPYDFIPDHMQGSPERVHIDAAPCSPSHTWIQDVRESGAPEVLVGTGSIFTLQAKDAYGNNVDETGMTIQIVLQPTGSTVAPINSGQPLSIAAKINSTDGSALISGQYGLAFYGGAYDATYTAETVGVYAVTISAGLSTDASIVPVTYSPFMLTITPGPPARVVAVGPGMLGAEAGVQMYFSTTLYDRYNNIRDEVDPLISRIMRVFSDGTRLQIREMDQSEGLDTDTGDGIAPHDANVGEFTGAYTLQVTGTAAMIFSVEGTELQRMLPDLSPLPEVDQIFQVSYGVLDRGRATFDPTNLGNGVALARAGSLLVFSVQLLDSFQNRRLVDDAIIQVTVEALNNQGQWNDIVPEYLGISFDREGQYSVTLQLNSAKQYRMWVRTLSSALQAPTDADSLLVLEGGGPSDNLNSDDGGITLLVDPSSAVASRCIAQFQRSGTSNVESMVTIELYDVFDNRNRIEDNLQSVISITLTGPRSIVGVATWDPVDKRYIGTYMPIVSGSYRLEITLRNAPVAEDNVDIFWGPPDALRTTASGLGVIRTEPTLLSEVIVTVRDTRENLVRDDIADRFTMNFVPECLSEEADAPANETSCDRVDLISQLTVAGLDATVRGDGPNFALFAQYTVVGDQPNQLFDDNSLVNGVVIQGTQLTDGKLRGDSASGVEASVGFDSRAAEVVVDLCDNPDLCAVVAPTTVRVFVGGGIGNNGGISAPQRAEFESRILENGPWVSLGEVLSIPEEEQWVSLELSPGTEMRYLRVVLERREGNGADGHPVQYVMIGEIQALGTYGHCDLDYTVTGEGTGNVLIGYQLEYDKKSIRAAGDFGTFCGNYPVDFTQFRYLLNLTLDGTYIQSSPFATRVGVYKAPTHKPYVTDSGGVEQLQTNDETVSAVAGVNSTLYFQNVYLAGYPGCEFDECMLRVDDNTTEQYDEQFLPTGGNGFIMQAVDKADGSIMNPPTFKADIVHMGEGLYSATYLIQRVGEFSVQIQGLTSGNAIGGMPFNATIVAASADPVRMTIQGSNRPTEVDTASEFTVSSFDAFGNRRTSGTDVIGIIWDGTTPNSEFGTNGLVISFDTASAAPFYTVRYMVKRCTNVASFYVTVNGMQTGSAQTVPCAAGPIGSQTAMVVGSRTMPDGMASGQSETMTFQGKDRWGNLKTSGGDALSLIITIDEPNIDNPLANPPNGAPTGSIIDIGDGTYRMAYTVRHAGVHNVNVRILDTDNGNQDIENSPFLAMVGPGDLNPSNTFATLAGAALSSQSQSAGVLAEQEVGYDFTVTVIQRDANGNRITDVAPGALYVIVVGSQNFQNPGNPLSVIASHTVSGNTAVDVKYRDASGSIFSVDALTSGTYYIKLTPGPAVPANSVIVQGLQKTFDCVANINNVMVLQTRDEYQNECDEQLQANTGTFSVYLQRCDEESGAVVVAAAAANEASGTSDPLPACTGFEPGEARVSGGVQYKMESTLERVVGGRTIPSRRSGSSGQYVLTFLVSNVGYFMMYMQFDQSNILSSPYTILSDTAAVPGVCQASGPGLVTAYAGEATQIIITARGGTLGNPVNRQGSGDNFQVSVQQSTNDGGSTLVVGAGQTSSAPVLEYIGGGRYAGTYWAAGYDQVNHPWTFALSIELRDSITFDMLMIYGSVFSVEMYPAATSNVNSCSQCLNAGNEFSSLTVATAGAAQPLSIQGKDRYNNFVSECVAGFAAQMTLISAENSRDPRGDQEAACVASVDQPCAAAVAPIYQRQASQLSCVAAEYVLEYNVDDAGEYILDVTFGGEQIGRNIGGGVQGEQISPFSVTVQSSTISAVESFFSTSPAILESTELFTGELPEFTAGQPQMFYLHAFDRFRNRLTHGLAADRLSGGYNFPECNPIADCVQLDYQWCRAGTNFTLLSDSDRGTCESLQLCSAWPAALEHQCNTRFAWQANGLYSVVASLTKAGTFVSSGWVGERTDGQFFANSGFLIGIVPDIANALTTVATPSSITVAGEYITFKIRAYDSFRNFVGEAGLGFSARFTFPEQADGFVYQDDGEGGLVRVVQTTPVVTYVASDGTYDCEYIVQTGGVSMPILLTIYLDGVPVGPAYDILVRAAQNKPALCYVMTDTTGPMADRFDPQRQSLDLLNPGRKAAGELLEVYVQSMLKPFGQLAAPRKDLSQLCNATQIELELIDDCDQLDEFTAVLQLTTDSSVRFDDTTTITCDSSAWPGNVVADGPEVEWIINDCARTGQYMLSYYATVSGAYDLSITSLGLVIQTSSDNVPPWNFEWYMPVQMIIYPADMSAEISQAVINELAFTQHSTITVQGLDRFGNQLVEHTGESAGLLAVLQTSCDKPPVQFSFVYDDTSQQTGLFRATVTPNFGGPVTIFLMYDPTRSVFSNVPTRGPVDAHTRTLFMGPAGALISVGGMFYTRIALLGSSDSLPNTGMTVGGTSTNIPMLGACEWTDGWTAEVMCKWDSRSVEEDTVLSHDWTYPRSVSFYVGDMTEVDSRWYVRARGGPIIHDYTFTEVDFANATMGNFTTTWELPAGEYTVYLENPNFATNDMGVQIVDELGVVIRQLNMAGAENYDFRIMLQPSRLTNCGIAPSKAEVTGSLAQTAHIAQSSVSIRYHSSTDPLFAGLDTTEWHRSVNTRSFFYYPPPTMHSVNPTSVAYTNNSWSHTYVPTTGGMPLSIYGEGFDNGDGAVKSYYLCVFADFDCTRAAARGGQVVEDPTHNWEYGDQGCHTWEPRLDNTKTIESHPDSLWITTATYIDDTEVQCETPPVDGGDTGRARVMLTMNSQELPPSELFVEFFGLYNVTDPLVSPISGEKTVQIKLVNGPDTENAWCKVWYRGSENVEGMPSVPAVRINNETMACITPNALEQTTSARRMNMENQYNPISISFDNEVFSAPSYFLYFAQPDIGKVFPPIGPTGGMTPIRIELQAGTKYDRPTEGYTALDYHPITNLDGIVPRCLFKRTPSLNARNRGVFYERGWSPDLDVTGPAVWRFEMTTDEESGIEYESQQIMCLTPGNPNPGSYYYLEVSLDFGQTYCYENGQKATDPPKFRYFADTQVVTEDRMRSYNSATFFRTAASDRVDWDSTVEVWFTYSCGYSPMYASFIRCKFDDRQTGQVFISLPIAGSLRLGADSINSVVCDVPQRAIPSSSTLQLSLNGIDYTPVGDDTYFVWFGRAVAVNGAFVQSVGAADRQIQFTTRAQQVTLIDPVICEIVDSAENYVSEDVDFQSAPSMMSIELTGAANNSVKLIQHQNLTDGMTYYAGVSLWKPKQGNYELILLVQGLISGMVPMTIVVGDMNITNSIVTDDPTPPVLDITPGLPFAFTVRGRDSADNPRTEGGENFKFTVTLLHSNRTGMDGYAPPGIDTNMSWTRSTAEFKSGRPIITPRDGPGRPWREVMDRAVSEFSPNQVKCRGFQKEDCINGNYAVDVGDGSYNFAPFVDTQFILGETGLVYLWGDYRIDIEGEDRDGEWVPLLNSPLYGTINVIDCGKADEGGVLKGSVTNELENMCQCVAGWEESSDQSSVEQSPVKVHCTSCPMGRYKPLGGREVDGEELCTECPLYTHTIFEGAVEPTDCICQENYYDWRKYELLSVSEVGGVWLYGFTEKHYSRPVPINHYNDLCRLCPEPPSKKITDIDFIPFAMKCHPNNSIELFEGWWTYDEADRATPVYPIDETGEKDWPIECEEGVDCDWNEFYVPKTLTVDGIARVVDTRETLYIYKCLNFLVDSVGKTCKGGISAAMEGHSADTCIQGSGYVTCGACVGRDEEWMNRRDGSFDPQIYTMQEKSCEPCGEDELSISVDLEILMLVMILVGFGVKAAMKLLEKATAEDLLIGKILLAFGQVLQSFSTTYSVTWPPKLFAFIGHFKIINFDVFEIGNLECEFPRAKTFYTKFVGTFFLPMGILVLIMLKFLHHRRRLKHTRKKFAITSSLLEQKIEAIEISGGYLSKGFFALIVTYLKTSATVLQMFSCRMFEPSAGYDYERQICVVGRGLDGLCPQGRLNTDQAYLNVDLRLSCRGSLHIFFIGWGVVGILVYPLGVPLFFFLLMFRERDQIHDAINKMKFGFLFADYKPAFFMFEIFDLIRKLSLSGLMIFFAQGSVTQLLCAMILSLIFLQCQTKLNPYAFPIANLCQFISFNSITFTLLGGMLLKVEFNGASDSAMDVYFCDNFVLFACIAVPLFSMCATCFRVAYEIYLTTTGQYTRRFVGSTARITFNALIANHYNKVYSTGPKKKRGLFKYLKKLFMDYCWKTEDIDKILLAEEMLLVQQRKTMKDRCEIYLMAAKVNLAEKREWLRFVKNNSANQREFNDIVQNESIDTYKRRILGADTVDEEAAFWTQFEGGKESEDVMSSAFKHEAYAHKYRDDFGTEKTWEEIDDEIDIEYRVVRSFHMSQDLGEVELGASADSQSGFADEKEEERKKKNSNFFGNKEEEEEEQGNVQVLSNVTGAADEEEEDGGKKNKKKGKKKNVKLTDLKKAKKPKKKGSEPVTPVDSDDMIDSNDSGHDMENSMNGSMDDER